MGLFWQNSYCVGGSIGATPCPTFTASPVGAAGLSACTALPGYSGNSGQPATICPEASLTHTPSPAWLIPSSIRDYLLFSSLRPPPLSGFHLPVVASVFAGKLLSRRRPGLRVPCGIDDGRHRLHQCRRLLAGAPRLLPPARLQCLRPVPRGAYCHIFLPGSSVYSL